MEDAPAKYMRLRAVTSFLAALLLTMSLIPLGESHAYVALDERETLSFSTENNSTAGWFVGAGGQSNERIGGMLPLDNGQFVVTGSYESNLSLIHI